MKIKRQYGFQKVSLRCSMRLLPGSWSVSQPLLPVQRGIASFEVTLSNEQVAEATGLAVDEIAKLRIENKQ